MKKIVIEILQRGDEFVVTSMPDDVLAIGGRFRTAMEALRYVEAHVIRWAEGCEKSDSESAAESEPGAESKAASQGQGGL